MEVAPLVVVAPPPPHLHTVLVLIVGFLSGYWVWSWVIWLLPNPPPKDRGADATCPPPHVAPTLPDGALRLRGRAITEPVPTSPPLASSDGSVRFR